MEVYIEVIALDNFIIDYIILHFCGVKERFKPKIWRVCLASFFGVAIAIISTFKLQNVVMLALKIICSLAMVFTAFGKKKFWKLLFDFYIFTFAIGGSAMGLLYLKEGVNFGTFNVVSNIPTGVIIGVIFLGYILTKRIIYIFSGDGVVDSYSYTVEVVCDSVSHLLSGFLDSGNMLVFKDDLRGVCVSDYSTLGWIFKGQKPLGHVVMHTAVGDDFLCVYKLDEIKVYKVDNMEKSCGKCGKCKKQLSEKHLVLKEKDVNCALSKVAISDDFQILLPAGLFY